MPQQKPRKAKRRTGHHLNIATPEKYRLVITYPGDTRTRQFSTSDLARARSIARRNAALGAHVDFQHNQGWGRYRTVNTYSPTPEPQ